MAAPYKNLQEAEQGLTSAFSPSTPEQQAAIKNAAALVPGAIGQTIPPPPKTIEPTTLSSTNVTDKYIPDYKKRLNLLTGGGAYTGIDGNNYAADGSPLQDDRSKVNGTSVLADDPAQNKLLTEMMRNLDASTAASLSAVNQQASALRSKQERINKSSENATEQALLLGGSSRYSISSGGIAQAQKSYGLEQIAQIDAEERQAISRAEEAQRQGKYQIMGQALQIAEKRRQEKQVVAEKMLEQQTEELNKLQQREEEMSIVDMYSQGVTSPKDLFNALEGTVPLETINSVLKNVVPPGLDDLVKTLRQNGAPADVISKVLKSSDLNAAYDAAGTYGAGGTGVIGEYNYARNQGYTGTFIDYQNEDANRKAKASSGGDRALTVTEAQALGVPFGTKASEAYGFIPSKPPTEGQSNAAIYADRIAQADKIIESLETGITKMRSTDFALQVGIEPYSIGSALVSDTIRQQRQAERNFINAVLRRESGAVIAQSEFDNAAKQYFPRPGDDEKTLAQKKEARATALAGIARAAGPAWDGTTTAQAALASDKDFVSKIATYSKKSPENAQKVSELAKIAPNATAAEIAKLLGI